MRRACVESQLSYIEFDSFTGHAAGCMPGILHQAGYTTYVSNAYQPDYFNSTKAYTGIGFEKLYYPIEFSHDRETYLTASNASDVETYLFDGDLFNQNLAFIARTLREHPGQPIFNYVLTMYGHEPHDIDTQLRPLVLSMKAPHDDQQLLAGRQPVLVPHSGDRQLYSRPNQARSQESDHPGFRPCAATQRGNDEL